MFLLDRIVPPHYPPLILKNHNCFVNCEALTKTFIKRKSKKNIVLAREISIKKIILN